ncbi:MAG TPA: hypothetical protein VL426_00375 [Candidatus Binatia bacterium]|jgi:hypothetical protein|nr:hypothetical protein [Candidatus Binatia bacterium]
MKEQRTENKGQRRAGLKVFTAAVVAMVAAVIAVGLYVAGSPSKERERRFDEQRVNELQQIANAVDNAYYRDGHLPSSLEELAANKQDNYVPSIVDPATRAPYEYRTTDGDTYELCATFDDVTQQTDQYGRPQAAPVPTKPMIGGVAPGYRDWNHPAGRYCYELTVEPRMPTQACGLTNPCQAGQTCAQLPNKNGTFCVPAGKECLAAGCPDGQCVIMESYPAQVRCTTEKSPPPPPSAKSSCTLMRDKASGKVDCFGCGTKVCKDPAPGWEPYNPPKDQPGIPYACYDDNGTCALAQ